MGVSLNSGTPIAESFIMENPTKMYDEQGYPYEETSTFFRILSHEYPTISLSH